MTTTTRVADYGQSRQLLNYIQQTQRELAEARKQAETGQKAEFYADLGTQAHQLINVEHLLSQTQTYIDNNDYVNTRIGIYEITLSKLIEIGTDYKNFLSQIRSLNFQAFSNGATLVNNMLSNVTTLLNSQDQDGLYVYGGNRTDKQPVNLSLMIGFPPTGGAPDYTYYQGDPTVLTLPIEDQLTINYGILATNTAIEPLIRALRLGATMPFTPPLDQLRVEDAMNAVSSAISSLSDLFAQMGSTRKRIEDINDSHENYKIYLNEIRSPLMDADLEEVLPAIAQLMVQLEASYSVVQKLFTLSLMDYLR